MQQLLSKGVPFAIPPVPHFPSGWLWFSCHLMDTLPNVIRKVQCCLPSTPEVSTANDTKWRLVSRCNTLWSSDVRPVQPLLQLLQQRYVRVRKYPGLWHPTTAPYQTSKAGWRVSIRAFLICPVQTCWFQPGGILAEVNALWIMQFTAAWQGCRPSLKQQLRPCVARYSTMVPQLLHSWGLTNWLIRWKIEEYNCAYCCIRCFSLDHIYFSTLPALLTASTYF